MTDDQSRHAATSPDEYSLTIDDVAVRYEHAGHPRTIRTLQRYCAKGHLECLRQETTFGDKYMITPASVARHIAQIEELAATSRRDMSRPDAAAVAHEPSQNLLPTPGPTSPDLSRPVATDDRYIERLEGDIEFLRGQVAVKDEQIKDLTERAHETNSLIAGLQKMLTPLLGRSPQAPHEHEERG
jgi:hypothetical protein